MLMVLTVLQRIIAQQPCAQQWIDLTALPLASACAVAVQHVVVDVPMALCLRVCMCTPQQQLGSALRPAHVSGGQRLAMQARSLVGAGIYLLGR